MNKKKILLLSDDLRSHSGVATMSKEIVLGTIHKYDWVQLGTMINHPEMGKVIDISEDLKKNMGIENAYMKVYPYNTYGDMNVLRQIIKLESPDAILHFTDPHFWIWLYDNEHEIRKNIPIMYYHIWDNIPDPKYNRDYYESCDWIGCISKQTYGIVKRVGKMDTSKTYKPLEDWQVSYVPHGVNPNIFRPLTEFKDEGLKSSLLDKNYKFILFFNNRNIRRKKPADVMYAYKLFCDDLPVADAMQCVLVMHTSPVDDNGTDLIRVKNDLCPNYNVLFSQTVIGQDSLNEIYNMADCTINISDAEGFGIATAESVMAGTPIIVNVTGGLQDQCGFNVNGLGFEEEDYVKFGSLHNKEKWDFLSHGEWVVPVWSTSHKLNGSPMTPYIYDDNVNVGDVKDAIMRVYNWGRDKRKENGLKGREWFMKNLSSQNMCNKMIEGIETTFANFKKKNNYELYKII